VIQDASSPEKRSAAMRAEFDQSFAAPRSAPHTSAVELLAIRVAGQAYALRLSEVGFVAANRRVVRLPSPQPTLAGLSSVRGMIMAVYDLGAILGHPRNPSPRWLIQASRAEPIALAFEAFEGQLRVDAGQIAMSERPADPAHARGGVVVHQIVGLDGPARSLIDVSAVIATIEQQIGPRLAAKER
jgi:chemotaxis signal transduction protein